MQVLAVLWSFFLIPYLMPSRRGNTSWAVRTRQALEKLGGTWVKLGQALSLRFDLLPAAFCYEFFKLLNAVPPFDYAQVREIVKRELGDYPEALFLTFEEAPFASASVGQVHKATLPTGERVAVKVQRPGIRQSMRTDIDLMYALTGILDRTRLFLYTPSREVIDEFARWAVEELDYSVEGRHAAILHQNSQGDALERIPEVYWKYSSRRVLTTELLDGVPLFNILQAIWNDDVTYLNGLEARGYDLQRISGHIDWNMLNQIYVNGYFHADIHPANIIVLPGNAIGYVDFGIVGELTDEIRESLIQYTWNFYQGNTEQAVAQLTRWMKPSSRTNMAAALRDLTNLHDDYLLALRDPSSGRSTDSAATFAVNVLTIIRRHGMDVSPGVLAYVRTIVTADTLRAELAPGSDFLSQIELFFARLISQQAREWLDPRKLISGAFDYGYRGRRALSLVESLQGTIEELAGIYASTSRGARTAARWLRAIAIFAFFAGLALFVVRASPNLGSGRLLTDFSFDWFTLSILVLVVVLIVTVLVQSRRAEREHSGVPRAQATMERQWQEPR
jgi:predicted unusual protein kinase regulating ubiquinone biosynthesis (AarF/ABC1/UbiB family)